MITKEQLQYLGAVRTPEGMFHYSGQPASIDFSRREYVMTHWNQVGRLSMVRPQLPRTQSWVTELDLLDRSSVPEAPAVGSLVDLSNNTWHELNADNSGGSGYGAQEVYILGNVALQAGSIYYDANGTQDVSWFAAKWPATAPAVRTPWRSIAGIGEGWAAGPMTIIPERFRELLKGDVLFGQPGAMPIITRQSFGPCAISAKASDFLSNQDIPAKLLLGYGNGELALWGIGANDIWNAATTYNSLTFIGDYLVYIGCHGYGEAKYGKGTSDPSLDGVFDPSDGGTWVYDPVAFGKGTHAFPYRVQGLGYKVSDLGDVAAGLKKPGEVQPAFWFPIEFPTFDHPHYGGAPPGVHPTIDVCGAEFDSATSELHVIVRGQDSHGYEPGPLDHVFKVSGIPATPNASLLLEFDGSVIVQPPPPPPPPPVEPPVEPPVIDPPTLPPPPTPEIDALKAQIAALTAEVLILTNRLGQVRTKLQAVLTRLQGVKSTQKWLLTAIKDILAL